MWDFLHDSMGPPPKAIAELPPVCPAHTLSANAAPVRTPALRRNDLRFSEITVQLQNWSEPSIGHRSRSAGFYGETGQMRSSGAIDGAGRGGCSITVTSAYYSVKPYDSFSRFHLFFRAFSRFFLDACAFAADVVFLAFIRFSRAALAFASERFLPPLRPSRAASGSFRFAMRESYHSKRDSPSCVLHGVSIIGHVLYLPAAFHAGTNPNLSTTTWAGLPLAGGVPR